MLIGRTAMTNLDSVLNSREITLPTKVHLGKATVFPVVMYGCESWTIKKAEHWRIDAFELWCWRRLLKSPLDCKEIQPVHPKGNQPWIVIGKIDAETEAPILFILLMWRSNSLKKTLMQGKIEGERRERQRMRWLGWTWISADSGRWWRAGKPVLLQSIGSQRVRHDWTTKQQQETRRWLNRPCKILWRRAITAFSQGWTGDSLPPGFMDLGRGVGYRLLPPSVEAVGIRCSYVSPLVLHWCCLFHLHPQKGEYTNDNPFNNGDGRLVPQVCDSLYHGVLHDTHVCAGGTFWQLCKSSSVSRPIWCVTGACNWPQPQVLICNLRIWALALHTFSKDKISAS